MANTFSSKKNQPLKKTDLDKKITQANKSLKARNKILDVNIKNKEIPTIPSISARITSNNLFII